MIRGGKMAVAAGAILLGLGTAVMAAGPTVDSTTRGNWVGTYGSDGYILFGWTMGTGTSPAPGWGNTGTDVNGLTAGWTYSITGGSGWAYSSSANQTAAYTNTTNFPVDRYLRSSTGAATPWTAAGYQIGKTTNATGTLTINKPANFTGTVDLALYFMDMDGGYTVNTFPVPVRSETVAVEGAAAQAVTGMHNGVWLVWTGITMDAANTALTAVITNTTTSSGSVDAGISAAMIHIQPVPEPAALGLLSLGGLLVMRRRR